MTKSHEEDLLKGKRCLRCAAWFEYKPENYCSDSCKQFACLERKTKAAEVIKKKTGFIKRIINIIKKVFSK